MNLWPSGPRKKLVAAALILLISGLLFFVGANYLVHQRGAAGIVSADQAPQADAILVLGAYIYENGKVSPILRDRLLVGLELYQKGVAPKLLVSGDHGQKNYDEVNAMRKFLEDEGVPPEDIFTRLICDGNPNTAAKPIPSPVAVSRLTTRSSQL